MSKEQIKFNIVVPFYNAEKWIKDCIQSIQNQSYKNFSCLIINDCSTDNSEKQIKELNLDSRFHYQLNNKNKGALCNIVEGYEFLKTSSQPESVLTVIDGDDNLFNPEALQIISDAYNDNQRLLLTYGNWIGSNGQTSNCRDYPDEVLENRTFRQYPLFITSHVRTYKSKLWHLIDLKDLVHPVTDEYFRVGWDVAFMMPMLEMAGSGRIKFIKNILLKYNIENPISDHYIHSKEQSNVDAYVRSLPPYEKLND